MLACGSAAAGVASSGPRRVQRRSAERFPSDHCIGTGFSDGPCLCHDSLTAGFIGDLTDTGPGLHSPPQCPTVKGGDRSYPGERAGRSRAPPGSPRCGRRLRFTFRESGGRDKGVGRRQQPEQGNGRGRPVKLFACQSCQQMVFFESVTCTKCGHALGYAPDRGVMCALEPEPPVWRAVGHEDGPRYRLCRNQIEHGVCNWLVPDGENEAYCQACRLNHIIPNSPRQTPRRPGIGWRSPSAACSTPCSSWGCRSRARPRTPSGGWPSNSAGFSSPDGPQGLHRAQRGRHHDQHRRGRRSLPREDAHADGRDLPHRARPLPPRDRPLLLGPPGRGQRRGSSAFRELFGDERVDYAAGLAAALRRAGRRPTGRSASSAPTRRCTRGRTGRRPGRTICTWSTRWRPRAATACRCARAAEARRSPSTPTAPARHVDDSTS